MLPMDRMERVFNGEIPDRVPFVPTIYEHAASLMGITPSELATEEDLLVKGQLMAYEHYGHDLVVLGVDVYNVEVEALGAKIKYYTNNDIPGLTQHLLEKEFEHLFDLKVPNPKIAGRMPLLLNAAKRVKESIGEEVSIGISIVGPYTLAALLRGYETFSMDLLTDHKNANILLDFSKDVGIAYASAARDLGLGIVINESWIAQPLLSPKVYRNQIFPYHCKMMEELKAIGFKRMSLISGGDTTAIVDDLVNTGSSLLMADYNTDLEYYKVKAMEREIVLRGSISSKRLEKGPVQAIQREAEEVLNKGSYGGRFVLGCGVVSYHTPPQHLLALKEVAVNYKMK